jgi:hypothetical protein
MGNATFWLRWAGFNGVSPEIEASINDRLIHDHKLN